MSPLSLRSRLDRSRGVLTLGLIVGLGLVLALHHADLMPMDQGHDGAASVGMTGAMICLGVLAVGFAIAPRIGAIGRLRRPERAMASCIRQLPLPPAPEPQSRAGPATTQVFRL